MSTPNNANRSGVASSNTGGSTSRQEDEQLSLRRLESWQPDTLSARLSESTGDADLAQSRQEAAIGKLLDDFLRDFHGPRYASEQLNVLSRARGSLELGQPASGPSTFAPGVGILGPTGALDERVDYPEPYSGFQAPNVPGVAEFGARESRGPRPPTPDPRPSGSRPRGRREENPRPRCRRGHEVYDFDQFMRMRETECTNCFLDDSEPQWAVDLSNVQ